MSAAAAVAVLCDVMMIRVLQVPAGAAGSALQAPEAGPGAAPSHRGRGHRVRRRAEPAAGRAVRQVSQDT